MKKILFVLIICSLAFSCKKASYPELDVKGHTLFTASVENIKFGTDASDNKWDLDDNIGVFGSESGTNVKYILKKAGEGVHDGEFYGPCVEGSDVVAYYPYKQVYNASFAGGLPSTLEGTQQYVAANTALDQFLSYNPAAFATLRDAKLTFEYPYGLLQVKVMTDDVVEGFRLESPAAAISGAGRYVAGGYVMDAASSKTVELALSEPVHTKTDTGNTAFWFVLPCGSYALLNLTITFEGGEESGCALQNITIKRVTPTDFEVAAVEVGTDDLDGFVPETVEFDK